MLFEGRSQALSGWFATHPPLLERIRALEPSFDPRDLPAPDAAVAGRAGRRRCGARQRRPGSSRPAAPAAPRAHRLSSAPARSRRRRAARCARRYPTSCYARDALARREPARSSSRSRCRATTATRRKQLALRRATARRRTRGALQALARRARASFGRAPLAGARARVADAAPAAARASSRISGSSLTRVQALEPAPRLFDFVLLRVLKTYLHDVPGVEPAPRRADAISRRTLGRARSCSPPSPHSATSTPSAARAAYEAGHRLRRLASCDRRADIRAAGGAARPRASRLRPRRAGFDPAARQGARAARRLGHDPSRRRHRDAGTRAVPRHRDFARLPAAARRRRLAAVPAARVPRISLRCSDRRSTRASCARFDRSLRAAHARRRTSRAAARARRGAARRHRTVRRCGEGARAVHDGRGARNSRRTSCSGRAGSPWFRI